MFLDIFLDFVRKERIFDGVGHLVEDAPIRYWFVLRTCHGIRVRVSVIAKAGLPLLSIGTAPLRYAPSIRRMRVVAAAIMGVVILTI